MTKGLAKSKFNLVLFDFDGTLADTCRSVTGCARLALEAFGYEEADMQCLRRFIGPPLVDSFMEYCSDIETAEKMVDKYREHYSAGGMYDVDLYDGVQAMLEALSRSGCTLAIASSKPGEYVAAIMDRLGIADYFSFISAPEIGHVNPTKAQLIEAAVNRLSGEKCSTVMVGDRVFDIEGAKQAGVASIGAVYGFGGEDELVRCGADMLAFNTKQITEMILDEGNS